MTDDLDFWTTLTKPKKTCCLSDLYGLWKLHYGAVLLWLLVQEDEFLATVLQHVPILGRILHITSMVRAAWVPVPGLRLC